jgi:hypothetical protein
MGNKLLPVYLQSDRNWVEDFEDENGMYENICTNCNKEFVGLKYRRICKKCVEGNKVPAFDFEAFKEYVNTYNPSKHGQDNPDTIFLDMLYGVGCSVDEAFHYHQGFSNFKEMLVDRFEKKEYN